jgi:hypothetical protein
MTLEEMNRTIEFIIQQSAQFSIGMQELKQRNEEFLLELKELKESTARFQSWAAEIVAIESKRLDEHDQLHRNTVAFHAQAIHLLHLLLDRLPPAKN